MPPKAVTVEARTLDVAERQVLIDCPDDSAGLRWHHRLRLQPTPTPGVWLAASPDYEVLRCDLNQHRVITLSRDRPLPPERASEGYAFDVPHSEEDLRRARQEARELLQVLGITGSSAPVGEGGSWHVADRPLVVRPRGPRTRDRPQLPVRAGAFSRNGAVPRRPCVCGWGLGRGGLRR